MIKRIAKLALLILSISGCSYESEPKTFYVTKEQYGNDWPFKIDKGKIICSTSSILQKPLILFEYDDKKYQLLPDSGKMNHAPAYFLFQGIENSEIKDSAAFTYRVLQECKSI